MPVVPRSRRRSHASCLRRRGAGRSLDRRALIAGVPCLLLLLGLATPAPAQETDADPVAIAERASKVYRELTSFGADFKQVIDDSMLGSYASRGRLIQSGTAKLAMRFSDPAGDAIVMDGQKVWIFTPSTTPGQVIRMPIPTGPRFGFNVLAWLLDEPNLRYHITYLRADQSGGHPADVIQLEPLDADLPFDRAVLWLDQSDALPRRLEIRERRGAYRTLVFSRVTLNSKVTDETFRFRVPSGVKVIDQ